jgi:predicted CopG family antitoxin
MFVQLDEVEKIKMPNTNFKLVAIHNRNYERLRELGRSPDSFNTVIGKLLDFYDEKKEETNNDNDDPIMTIRTRREEEEKERNLLQGPRLPTLGPKQHRPSMTWEVHHIVDD